MELPKKLINEFAKVTNDSETPKGETTVYGTIVKNGDSIYVKLDGSDLTTPISTTTDVEDGDRVTVLVKNHTAVVTGNMTSPSARTDDVKERDAKFDAEVESLKVGKLSADEAKITYATIKNLEVADAKIENLKTDKLSASDADIKYATIKNLEATDAKIDKLAATDFDAKYANIDFANINMAAVEKLFSDSGIIKDLVVSSGQITGELVGVTIKGDLIEGNTVVADKLVVKGEDGLYYKLNTDGMTVEAQQTDYNSLNGSIITAKSITATKIAVDDLVAFDATIGGFNITSGALYSGTKASVDNTTQGIYLGKDGQIAIGDSNNFLKYYKTSNGSYKLELAFGGDDIQTSITDATNTANDAATDAANADSKATNALSTATDAAKTATNFLSYDSTNGLQIGNKSAGSWNGYRTQITSSEFNILNSSGTEVASYGSNLIELGKNSTDSVIKLCGGEGTIAYETLSAGSKRLRFSADSLSLSGQNAYLSSMDVSNASSTRSMVSVGQSEVEMYVSGVGVPGALTGGSSMSMKLDSGITLLSPKMSLMCYTINFPGEATITDSNGSYLSAQRGSSGTWDYKKWSNGDVELWGYLSVSNKACSTALGNMYRTAWLDTPSFPFTVYSPNVTASYESDGYGGLLWPSSASSTSKPPNYCLVRPTSTTIVSGKITFHVYGKWKT